MADELGDVQIDGRWYRIDLASYRDRDIVDFAPKASSPGGGIIHSELMLYQPLLQNDWKHGFGFQRYTDASGYQKTIGNVDTRHDGIAMLFSNKVLSTSGFRMYGATMHKKIPYFYGPDGIGKYTSGEWSLVLPNPVTTETITNGSFETFSSPNFTGWTNHIGSGAITQTTSAGEFYDLTAALKITMGASDDTYIDKVLTVVPGSVYTVKFWQKSDASHGVGRFKIYDVTNAADIVALKNCTAGSPTTTYTETVETWTAPVGCTSAQIIFYPNSTNTAINYFDKVTVTSTTRPTVNTNVMFSLGDNLFAVPYEDRIMRTSYAGEIQIQPSEVEAFDTFLSEDYPTTNYGTNAELYFGSAVAANKKNNIILKFPLTSIPAGATITEAKLTLYCNSVGGTVPNITISRLLSSTISESESTWNSSKSGTAWNTAGATGSGTDIDSTPVCTVASPTVTARQFYTFTLTAAEFAKLISVGNYGLLLHGTVPATGTHYAKFASSSETNYDWRPYITVKYTLAEDWVDTGVDEGSKDYHWSLVHNGYTYLGVRNTNRIHYSSNLLLSDLEGTTADTGAILVGAGTHPTLKAISYLGYIYIARADGLWQLGDDKIARRVLDFSSESSELNFESLIVHNGYLTFSIRDVIYQWNGSRLTRITPQRLNDDWPYLSYGLYSNFVSIGDFLYCTARTNEDVYTESLLCFDGVSWHKLLDLITTGVGKVKLLYFDVSNNYLWIHIDGSTPATYYIQFQERSVYPYSNFPTTGTHSLYSSVHDMGFSRVTKSTPSILIGAENLNDQTYLDIYYALDGGSWYKWGTVKDNGITELIKPSGLHTVEYDKIQLRVDFITTVATESPILESLTLRFLMRPSMSFGWNFNVVVADHLIYGEREDTRTAWEIIKDIRTARDSKAPIKFTDVDGGEYYGYLTAFSRTAQERNAGEEQDGVPSIESIINVNIVEAK